jgi:hypothetical protein
VEDLALPLLGDVESDQLGGALEAELDPRRLGQRRALDALAGPSGGGVLDEELRAEARRVARKVRIDALLPAVRPLRSPRCPRRR